MGANGILLLGANGQVGHELRSELARLGPVHARTRAESDLADPESLRRIVRELRPAIIVNAAAYTAVDRAESEAEAAHAVNAVAPGVLAEEAEAVGALLVHYSTDYVFDGRGARPYAETDATNPLSTYGRTKLAGERAVARACRRHVVFRISWVFGAHGANFLKTMLRLADERDSLRVVADQHGAPTSAELVARVTTEVLATLAGVPATDPRFGLYHLAPAGETTWHEYARRVIGEAAAAGRALKASPATVHAITSAEYPTPAHRPANSRLDTGKLRSIFGISLPPWEHDVDRVLHAVLGARKPHSETA
jgi:dTDP-4-dehydrorhamnose reductase